LGQGALYSSHTQGSRQQWRFLTSLY
jgi:hypothetical protein